jgi:hypothetical protein
MKAFVSMVLIISMSTCVYAQSTKITGEYIYTYGDNESLLEAKSLCYTMALRNAIESFTVYIQATSTIEDFRLKNDLIQTISSGYIDNLKIEVEKIEGRAVHYRLSGDINPIAVRNVIDNRVKIAKGQELPGLDKNSCLKILKVSEVAIYSSRRAIVVFKCLKRHMHIGPEERMNDDYDCHKIFIDFYDANGDPIGGDSIVDDESRSLTVGERTTVSFDISRVKSYRVWLYKGVQ